MAPKRRGMMTASQTWVFSERSRKGGGLDTRSTGVVRAGGVKEGGAAQLVERAHLEGGRLVGGAAPPVGRDGDAVGLAADAGHFDRAGVRSGVGVDLEPPQLPGRLAAEGDHPAVVPSLVLLRAARLGHAHILS